MRKEEIPKAADVKKGISVLWETLQCPICLEIMTAPVSTKCDHQFCKYCMMKLLDSSKVNRTSCPVCKARITRRSLQDSPGFQKLVAGLQDLIHAYEHDTGTSYFTGMILPNRSAITAEAGNQKLKKTSEDLLELDNLKNGSNDDVPKSQSSTIKAQNGFARLMGLDDSSPLTTENEGLDSGLGELPPALERKKSDKDILELITTQEEGPDENEQPTNKTRMLIKSADLPPSILEEETVEEDKEEGEEDFDEIERSLKKLSKKKRKKDSDPDKILKHRQKKSVEKVREWLKNVPTEEEIELDKSDMEVPDLNDSDSFSSASTIDLNQRKLENFVDEKDGPSKALEDQVFGAVYKRDKRKNGKRSPTHVVLSRLSSEDDVEPLEEEGKSDAVKELENINLVNDSGDLLSEPEDMDIEVPNEPHHDEQPEQESNDELQNVNDDRKEKDSSPLPQVEPRTLRKNARKPMRNALEQVDSDLQAKAKPESSETKKTDKKKSRQTRSGKVKSGRVAKPLDLVEVQNGDTVPMDEPTSKLPSDQVQVHIENYSSSEDQDAAVVKSTRRSKRLQTFVEEIRDAKKKPSPRQVAKSNNGVAIDEVSLAKKTASPKSAKPNGCIYDDDLGGIEKVGSCDSPNIPKPSQPLQEVPNVDIPSEIGCDEPAVPDCSRSSGRPDEINTVQESDIQTDPNNVNLESMESADGEEMEDDSEVDTEQLLRSFKATKRKSFHLEAPNVKRSRSLDERDGHVSEEALDKDKAPVQESFQNDSNLLFSDVIPPSATQAENEPQYQEEFDVPEKPISDSLLKSSAKSLSPNKATKFETPSPHLSVIPQVVNSGLRFTAAHSSDSVEPKNPSANGPSKCTHISESQCSKPDENSVSLLALATSKNRSPGNVSERLSNPENSLTPDGLLTRSVAPHVDVANSHDSSSAQSSVKTLPKRRKSRRLESSPEVDSSEELPSLAQIFKRSSSGSRSKEKGNSSFPEVDKPLTAEEGVQSSRPPRCPSPDYVISSQGSVDLFGTPEEAGGGVLVNHASASMELSQFSSEVLVTQQKIEMQKELLRLEKLMALVSEVLHEKENAPENNQKDSDKNSRLQGSQPCSEETEQEVDNAERNTRAGPSEVKTSKPNAANQSCTAEPVHTDPSAAVSKTSMSPQSHKNRESPSEDKENDTPPNDRRKTKLVLASSGLGPNEQMMVKKFAKRVGSRVVSKVTPDVTHIIMHTDEQLVCERTLKYFLGIAGRKWVVSFQWISECFKQKKIVEESLFEVRGDVVNGHNHQGPMRARTTDDEELLMKGYRICFQGPFTGMTTDEMGWMVELCGATVIKDPFVLDSKQMSHQLVIVQSGSDISASKYNSLSKVATVVTRGWLLDSVSAYTIQNCKNYTI